MTDHRTITVDGSYTHELSIPSTWHFVQLNEVIDIVGGNQPPKTFFSDQPGPDKIRLIQIRDYKSDHNIVYIPKDKAKRFVSTTDVMIGRYGPPIFQILRGLEGAYNVALMKAVPKMGVLDNEYLFHYLNNRDIYNYVNAASDRTAGQSGVNKAHLEKYPVGLPPLAEQKVIAEKLNKLLAKVDCIKARLDAIPDTLKRFRQSVLAAAVSGKLTEEWRTNKELKSASEILKELSVFREKTFQEEIQNGNKETKRLQAKVKKHAPEFPEVELPASWEWTSFMSSMERVVDCHNKTAPYIDKGIPLIRTPDIRNGKISLDGAKYISQDTYDYWSRRCPPKSGDIIFTREAPMGEAGIVPKGTTLCMGQRMMLLRPMKEFVNPNYILLNILSLNFQQRMQESAIGTGVKHLRVADVEGLTYPLAPFKEQAEIVRRVEKLSAYAEKVEAEVNAAQERVNKLTQSILAKAFRGELTAKWREQNPDLISGDNSAEALLAKIKAEREKLKPNKKTHTRKKV
ncbi:MAG: 4'-phosphopantetheinyl transferase [Pseudoalteromonas sp.]|uniref:restriction endonuclease subunit S n=1 Tax=Pseudoalteromonas TaxID=53246 RepID=UPI000C8E5696|nr:MULTISPECIES: restriction endonuclease subunit S [Pseudoalteromonas]MAD02433.1 4'-phosphopantetheinyl transferase [Pseudoalteromonas sp.]MDK9685751.1 restriction endonuclease subunit S [Pseudoalteromonas shioyasakiensis]|tara:strand:+ start:20785 stop:22326 length:1542 start_codon:yes stop_codon:yes gene_type:complete